MHADVSCFNASGGQVALGQSTNLEFRSNVIADGAITDGDPRFRAQWTTDSTPFQTHGFELTDELVNFTITHNDIRNNTGYSIIADRTTSDFTQYWNTTCKAPAGHYAFCPGNWGYPLNDSVHLQANRLGSVGNTTIGQFGSATSGAGRTLCANPCAHTSHARHVLSHQLPH